MIDPLPLWSLWHVSTWADLSSGRSQSGMGLAPLSWQDIHAWTSLRRVRLTPSDLKVIQFIDRLWLETQNEAQERITKSKPKKG